MLERCSAGLVATIVVSSIAIAPATPAIAQSGIESCFYDAIDEERTAQGRSRLVIKSDLVTIARRHSQRMAADGTIYHNKNLGREITGSWWAAGENVGMGPSCRSIHDAFMASAGHRANILDRDYNQIGVGVAIRDDTIYVTEDFAGRRSRPPRPSRAAVERPPRRSKLPRARPVAVAPEPRTLTILLALLGMDAKRIDPRTGSALGV